MKKWFAFGALSFIGVFAYSQSIFAQGNLNDATSRLSQVGGLAGTTQTDLGVTVGYIINAALTLVGIIFLILTVYAGYLWLMSRGESTEVEKSKKILAAAVIGLVVVMSAYAISKFVTTRFG